MRSTASSLLPTIWSTPSSRKPANNAFANYNYVRLKFPCFSVFGGIAIDYYGPEIGSLVSSLFNMVGALIAAIGASRGSYHMLVGGQIILGLGTSKFEAAAE